MGPREIARSKDVTAHPTEKAKKARPQPWEREKYIKKPIVDNRQPHGDPRLEPTLQSHGDVIPFDDDANHGSGYTAFGLGATSGLYARGELGTLAGGRRLGKAGAWIEQQMGTNRYQLAMQYYNATDTSNAAKEACNEYQRLLRQYHKNVQSSSQHQGESSSQAREPQIEVLPTMVALPNNGGLIPLSEYPAWQRSQRHSQQQQ
jgi:hypothetical protein